MRPLSLKVAGVCSPFLCFPALIPLGVYSDSLELADPSLCALQASLVSHSEPVDPEAVGVEALLALSALDDLSLVCHCLHLTAFFRMLLVCLSLIRGRLVWGGGSLGLARSANGSHGAKPVSTGLVLSSPQKVAGAGGLPGARGGSHGAKPVSTGLVLLELPKVVWAGGLPGPRGGSHGAKPVLSTITTGLVLSFPYYFP